MLPQQAVSFTPPYSPPPVPFPPSPSEKPHQCSHRLLNVSHTPSPLMPQHHHLPTLPLASFENGSLSALALITYCSVEKTCSQATTGPRPGSATPDCGIPEEVAETPRASVPSPGERENSCTDCRAKRKTPVHVMYKESTPRGDQ